jgi:hypothetical protein
MNSGQYSGQYKVLLEMRPGKMWHNGLYAFAGKNVKVEKSGTTKDMGAKGKIVQKA